MLGVCTALIDDEKDKKAFEKLYNKYKNKVHAISLNILKNNCRVLRTCSSLSKRILLLSS